MKVMYNFFSLILNRLVSSNPTSPYRDCEVNFDLTVILSCTLEIEVLNDYYLQNHLFLYFYRMSVSQNCFSFSLVGTLLTVFIVQTINET